MPRGNGTGPMGMGPMTGRAAGYCAGYNVPGFMNPYGRRMGVGLGWGMSYMGGGFPGYYAGLGGYQQYMFPLGGGFPYFGFGRGWSRGWSFGRGRGRGLRW